MKKTVITLKNRWIICSICSICSCLISVQSQATDLPSSNENEVLLDGISTVVSFNSSDDSSAMLVLASDVELIARVLLVNQYGTHWKEKKIDNAARFKARRLATSVKILAHVATLIGEKVDTIKRDKLVKRFIQKAGGESQVQTLLAQCGASKEDLTYWFSNFYMCRIQLQYLADQVQMPSQSELRKMFNKGDHPFSGVKWKDARSAYEQVIRDQKLQRVILHWLQEFEQQGKIDFAR